MIHSDEVNVSCSALRDVEHSWRTCTWILVVENRAEPGEYTVNMSDSVPHASTTTRRCRRSGSGSGPGSGPGLASCSSRSTTVHHDTCSSLQGEQKGCWFLEGTSRRPELPEHHRPLMRAVRWGGEGL